MNQKLQGQGLGVWTQGPKVGGTQALLTLLVFRVGSWALGWGPHCREAQ